ncbi:hypothetical protein ACFCW6_34515 [Streptomyces sp. NPDC056333]|uniref:hypothetical protein n=1 Tax=Streptomyces sp. NPDC056333 TaxID=3345786 RepID=UPI0035D625DB
MAWGTAGSAAGGPPSRLIRTTVIIGTLGPVDAGVRRVRAASGAFSVALSAPGGVHDSGPDLVGIGDADEVRAAAWNLSGTRPVPPHVRGRRGGG